jgi:hypothetical protein
MLLLPLVAHQVPLGLVGPRDYLLFFAPAHALGLLVVLAARNAGPARGGIGAGGLLAAGAGLLVAPAAVAAVYAAGGGLGYAAAVFRGLSGA